MVSIVIVSHSQQLAAGVRELARQMVQDQVAIAAAGGIDDPENPIGTDAMQILAAIEAVYSDDGVVVLMDLGSALLSAEMALEFLAPEQQAKVYLCAAPLVEGAVVAAVQAAAGSPVTAVIEEAMRALQPKQSQLATTVDQPSPITDYRSPITVYFLLAAICVGLAIGSKFTAVLLLLPLGLAVYMAGGPKWERWLLTAVAVTVLTFFLTNPLPCLI
ncbi:MAG: PTS-dependent dihydroxyacetone kinase phosphotransferase subunit DhaM [Anaerolineae bacterium]|nr:PTS-dependent dihydroxyacetone kinase phosphotransferase subunit DhaM [Anaerolineae bacterium]